MNSNHGDLRLVTGNANPAFAQAVSNALETPLSKCDVTTFSDGEICLSLSESVRGADVYVIQSTCNPVNQNLMELLLLIDALKRASADRINAVVPYYGYARQDRKAKSRDPISAKLVANLIQTAGADRLITMDLHAPQIQGFFDIPVDHLLGVSTLLPYYLEKFKNCKDDIVVVSPDLGSVTRSRSFAESIGVNFAIIDKRRPRANESEVMNIIGDVRGKKVIIIDDMIDTAGTLCNAADAVVERGGATEVYACATHGVLSGPALERISNSALTEVMVLDTIPLSSKHLAHPKIKTMSVASFFATAIDKIHTNKPISVLFD